MTCTGEFVELPTDMPRDTQHLAIHASTLTQLPPRLLFGLVSLQSFNASGCGLASIPTLTFSQSYSLETIDLSRNRITTGNLDQLGFSGISAQSTISLAHNQLTSLTFQDIPGHACRLDASSNAIGDNFNLAPPNTVKSLRLSDNGIRTSEAFRAYESLEELVLARNPLNASQQAIGDFFRLPELELLDLSHTGINLSSISRDPGPNLKQLFLKGVHLPHSELHRRFPSLRHIRVLDLSEASLTALSTAALPLGMEAFSLERLSLAENQITAIGPR